jgi:hypothetical protein
MDTPQFFITPMLSVHHDELYLYGRQEWIHDKPCKSKASLDNLKENSNRRVLSDKAKRKAKRAIKYLLFSAHEKTVYNPKFDSSFKFKVGFITLTLPSEQVHTDQEIKEIVLNHFLVEARKKWNVSKYVWKAERQKNGNIHFHVLTDRFVPYQDLRDTWNRIINKLGYVDRFQQKHGKRKPNTTDVHSLYKVKNISSYVTKYMMKRDFNSREKVSAQLFLYKKQYVKGNVTVSSGAKEYLRSISDVGRIWACSQQLSNVTGAQIELSDSYQREVEMLQKKSGSKRIDKDYVSCIYFRAADLNSKDTPLLRALLDEYLTSFFDDSPQDIVYPNVSPPVGTRTPNA